MPTSDLPYEVYYIRKAITEPHPVTGKFSRDAEILTAQLNEENIANRDSNIRVTTTSLSNLFGVARAVQIIGWMKFVAASESEFAPVAEYIIDTMKPANGGLDVSHKTAPDELAKIVAMSDAANEQAGRDLGGLRKEEADAMLAMTPVVSFATRHGWPKVPIGLVRRILQTPETLREGGGEHRVSRKDDASAQKVVDAWITEGYDAWRDGHDAVVVTKPSKAQVIYTTGDGQLDDFNKTFDTIADAEKFIDETLSDEDGVSLSDLPQPPDSQNGSLLIYDRKARWDFGALT